MHVVNTVAIIEMLREVQQLIDYLLAHLMHLNISGAKRQNPFPLYLIGTTGTGFDVLYLICGRQRPPFYS